MVRKIYPEYKPMLCVVMVWLMMKKYSCSIHEMVKECEARLGLCKKMGLDHVPSKVRQDILRFWLFSGRHGVLL